MATGLLMISTLPVHLAELDMSRVRRVQFERELTLQLPAVCGTVSDWCGRGLVSAREEMLALAAFIKVSKIF